MPVIAILIGILVTAADQLIKIFVSGNLKLSGDLELIPGLLKLTYTENRGVAFGMFKDMRWFFVILTSVMIAAIVFYMFKKRPSGRLFYVCAGLIIGGGIGNLIDRVLYGYVIDYISLSFFPPICNFADYCITFGVAILVIYILFFSDALKKKKDIKND